MKENIYRRKESWKLFNHIAQRYDMLNRMLSLNLDAAWRCKVANFLPDGGDKLTHLDIATGTGDQIIAIMHLTTRIYSSIGLDPAVKMLELAKRKISQHPFADQVQFVTGSGTDLPFDESSFDVITLSFGIRNIDDRATCLQEVVRTLKPLGRLLLLEFSVPKNLLIRPLALAYMRFVLPAVGGLVSKNRKAYTYLNDTIRAFPSPDTFRELMLASGFSTVFMIPLTCGVVTLYIGER